ncbi:hypothetical protein SPRG_20358 [Saprolegnia parasitica CBS 223.65]|uniref:ABC transmembrane type-1 domain-containing protein n=1 Tax=Saprolegnia parasitica (strain CBS 223.65) TaxID=695850 RepID=A0A067CBX3_SAPPC|nr:hypothetical protein SPRG_20358 [Saprolegnia parasitica CBS 223.65]KDO28008.1 hypothetical protein SPRG_20358 [Saprolegnia parasitica CBS 223.65]|eukprot:XP_012201469.1 hypothetical protein SPRG_20358 [Saprolegnia parasitica CBS 223.65]
MNSETPHIDNYALVTTPKNEAPPSETTPDAVVPVTPAPMVSFAKLFSFADTTDKVLLAIGTLGSMVMGVAQPLQIVFFGNVINAFNPTSGTGDDAFRDSINRTVIQFVIVGAIVLVTGVAQTACWSIAASRQTKRLRHAYASAILRQEVGWFDVNEPMQLATRVADTTLIIQEGMGRKVADAINFTTMAITGIVIGFVYGWDLALVLLALSPFVAGSGYYMVKTIAAATQGGVEAYAEAGGVAEEALSNIRTKNAAERFASFLSQHVPLRTKTTRKHISTDVRNNTANVKLTIVAEIAPLCKDDLVILEKRTAQQCGMSVAVVSRVTTQIHLVDPRTCRRSEVTSEKYWKHPFHALDTGASMVEFIVLDVEPLQVAPKDTQDSADLLAVVEVARVSDFGFNDTTFHVTSHLGQYLSAGDTVKGYDLRNCNFASLPLYHLKDELPDIILVRRVVPKMDTEGNRQERKTLRVQTSKASAKNREREEEEFDAFMDDYEEDRAGEERINTPTL